jgi:hypothetical protein
MAEWWLAITSMLLLALFQAWQPSSCAKWLLNSEQKCLQCTNYKLLTYHTDLYKMIDKTPAKCHTVIHWLILSKMLHLHVSQSQISCNYDQSQHSAPTNAEHLGSQLPFVHTNLASKWQKMQVMFSHQEQVCCFVSGSSWEKSACVVSNDKWWVCIHSFLDSTIGI